MTAFSDFTSNGQPPQTPAGAGPAPDPHAHTSDPAQTQQRAGPQAQPLTNAAFIQGIFGILPEGHCFAVAHFKDFSKQNWKAKFAVGGWYDHPEENAYYCPSSLIGESRTLDHFAALHVVVLDDITLEATAQLQAPTYAIETSAGNYQVGYKLAEPLTDKALAQELHNGLHSAGYCDGNGNNPVRWIRLPVGMNTKDGKGMFRHKVAVWEPDRTFNVEQLHGLLRLGQAEAPAPAPTPQAEQTVTVPVQGLVIETVDETVIADLRSALDFLAALKLDGYQHWQRWGSRLRSLGDAGYILWLEASTKSPKFNAREAADKWPKLGGERTGYKAILKEAQDRGWPNPRSNAARDPNAPPAPPPDNIAPDFVERMFERQAGGKKTNASMGGAGQKASPDSKKGADLLIKLRDKSATNKIEDMKKMAENEVLAFGEIGSLGQFISLHGLPGKGKTLITMYWVLQAIEKNIVRGDNVFYLNFDDNANGFIDKTEIAAALGFNMLGPNQASIEEVSVIIAGLCDNDFAGGTVFIFDTLKKFVDVMHKAQQTEFYKLLRRYVMSGGTVLTLGHVNKNRDANDKLIVAGTQDIADDVDALYVIDVVEGSDLNVVEVEKRKNRGMGVEVAYYSFGNVHGLESEDETGKHVNRYRALLGTVMPLANSTAGVSKGMMDRQLSMQKYQHVIEAIRVAISSGIGQQMQIVEAVNIAHGHGKNLIRKVLSAHTWTSTDNYVAGAGFLWFCVTGPNNSKNYTLTQG